MSEIGWENRHTAHSVPSDTVFSHMEDRSKRSVRCLCGYGPTDEDDLDQHILASMHIPGDHAEL